MPENFPHTLQKLQPRNPAPRNGGQSRRAPPNPEKSRVVDQIRAAGRPCETCHRDVRMNLFPSVPSGCETARSPAHAPVGREDNAAKCPHRTAPQWGDHGQPHRQGPKKTPTGPCACWPPGQPCWHAKEPLWKPWRSGGGQRRGPYFRLAYRDDAGQRSVYLGRSTELAEAVRGLLADRQRPRKERLQATRMRASVRAAIRQAEVQMAREMALVGVRVKGWEFRGTRRLWKSGAAPSVNSPTPGRTITGSRKPRP